MMSCPCGIVRSLASAAPSVPCTQWSGHNTCLPYARSTTSNGFLPGWAEANEIWAGVCQSWVMTTLLNALAIRLMTGTTCSPSFTARLPPGRKQFCTSITSSTAVSSGLIASAAKAARVVAAESAATLSPARTRRRSHNAFFPASLWSGGSKPACRTRVKSRLKIAWGAANSAARLDTITHGAETREGLRPIDARRAADHAQRARAAEAQPLHHGHRRIVLAAGGVDSRLVGRQAVDPDRLGHRDSRV